MKTIDSSAHTQGAPLETCELSYQVDKTTFWARRYSGGDAGRILLYPDWEGCRTSWADIIAENYARTCSAEVILTDHYGVETPKPSFDDAYAINQSLLSNPNEARPLFKSITAALKPYWLVGGSLIVIGFCSGGSFALETARAGSSVDAAFCIHGNPQTPKPLSERCENGPEFIVLHGAEDPLITPEQLQSFEMEMRTIRARWSLHYLSGAKHSFTRFDHQIGNQAVGYSRRAEYMTRHFVNAQIQVLTELSHP